VEAVIRQERLLADDLATEEHDMGTDTHPAERPTGQALEVVRRASERFYELLVDGQFGGLVVYEEEDAGRRYVLTHTFIAEGYRGQGLSHVLLRGVLEDLKARHITMTNYCPVLDRFIEKNSEYIPLVDPGKPGKWPKDHRDTGTRNE
jgi:predicted GNAT family acetyltransferase